MNVIQNLKIHITKKSINDNEIDFKDMIENKVYLISKNRLNLNDDGLNVYEQEPEKVSSIAMNMAEHGYDFTQLIIIDEQGHVLDGKSRAIAAIQCDNVTTIPVMVKRFKTIADAQIYQYHLQLSHRNLDSTQRFISFCKQEELKGESGKKLSDDELSTLLQTSTRNIQKMREIVRNVNSEQIQEIFDGKKSVNQVYNLLKNGKKSKTQERNTSKIAFSKSSFVLGVSYAILELAKGKVPEQIINCDFLKSEIKTFSLTEDEEKLLEKIRSSSEVMNGESRF